MDEQIEWPELRLAALRIREWNRREIERAIDRIKESRSARDDWFRRQWYRAAARRERGRRNRPMVLPGNGLRRWSS